MPAIPLAKIEAVSAAHSANAEPAAEDPGTPPTGAASEAGSASADVGASTTDAAAGTSPEATTPDEGRAAIHAALEAKLAADRARRMAKGDRRRARTEAETAAKERAAAAEERAKWERIGKEKDFRSALTELGKSPREVFEEMQREALEDGTPEAKIRKLESSFARQLDEVTGPLKSEIEALKRERDEARAAAIERGMAGDFAAGIMEPKYASLREEYEDPDLFRIARSLHADPARLEGAAQAVGIDWRARRDRVSMDVILEVLKATQDGHNRRSEERRAKNGSAATDARTAAPKQAPAAKPTVNGTAERNAGNTLGNDLASERASEAEKLRGMTRKQREDYLAQKHG